MRRLRFVLPVLLLVVVVVSAVLVLRARGDVERGPAFALCPGPDGYGYRCEAGAAVGYIDATEDTGLYSDDGVVLVDLPFAFTFYGSSYQQMTVGSNGTLQFTTENPRFTNECLGQGPVVGMGELIAPYWDDLDLTLYGFLETAVSGDPGGRVFVVEWDDVPVYGNPEERVRFEVQLFEGSNDIVFLYQDVTRTQGNHGRSATVGLQSEALGNTLQYGCNQLTLTNGLVVEFSHPEAGADAVVRPVLPRAGMDGGLPTAKGDMGLVLERLNLAGVNGLERMRPYWLSQVRPKDMRLLWSDLTGDGEDELIVLLRPAEVFGQFTELAVFREGGVGWELLFHSFPLARVEDDSLAYGRIYDFESAADLLAFFPSFEE